MSNEKNRYLKNPFKQTYLPLSTANLLKNNFTATQPAQKLCADFTFLLMAIIKDFIYPLSWIYITEKLSLIN